MHLANAGYCNICGTQTRFVAATAWLRDDYQCVRCKTIPRQRALLHILNLMRPNWRSLVLHESSPSIRYYAEQARSYTCSFFFDDVPPGGHDEEGRLCQNLEALVFPDGVFDVFITQDVLEHVFSPDRALAEIMRVLKPGGLHIFTAPKHKNILRSYPRAQLVNGTIQHLQEPTYHQNPIGDNRSLVTWDYGADFDDLITAWSGYCTSTYVIRDRNRGLDGEFLEVFAVSKDEANLIKVR